MSEWPDTRGFPKERSIKESTKKGGREKNFEVNWKYGEDSGSFNVKANNKSQAYSLAEQKLEEMFPGSSSDVFESGYEIESIEED